MQRQNNPDLPASAKHQDYGKNSRKRKRLKVKTQGFGILKPTLLKDQGILLPWSFLLL
jgi:hypothetical protein